MFVSAATSVRWSSDLTPSQMRYVTQHQCLTDSEMTCLRNGGKPWAQTFFSFPLEGPIVRPRPQALSFVERKPGNEAIQL